MGKPVWKQETWAINQLKAWDKNPRKIGGRQYDEVKRSLSKFGLLQPIIINSDGTIIGGHARCQAMIESGAQEVPVYVPTEPLSESDFAELNIRLNKNIAGEWDFDALGEFFRTDDLVTWGFKPEELTDMNAITRKPPADEAPARDEEKAQTVLGDVYQLNQHRVICGDSCMPTTLDRLLGNVLVDMVLTDPPYGVDYSEKDHAVNASLYSRKNKRHADIKNDTGLDYKKFFSDFLSIIPMAPKNTIYAFMSGQELATLRAAFDACEIKWGDYLIWDKQQMVMGRKDYHAQHEFIMYGWKGTHVFYGPSNCKTIIKHQRPQRSDEHPTMKPVGLLEILLSHGSAPGAVVYDAFTGSGSTLLACEWTGRTFYGCELSEHYVDVIVRRWIKYMRSIGRPCSIKLNDQPLSDADLVARGFLNS